MIGGNHPFRLRSGPGESCEMKCFNGHFRGLIKIIPAQLWQQDVTSTFNMNIVISVANDFRPLYVWFSVRLCTMSMIQTVISVTVICELGIRLKRDRRMFFTLILKPRMTIPNSTFNCFQDTITVSFGNVRMPSPPQEKNQIFLRQNVYSASFHELAQVQRAAGKKMSGNFDFKSKSLCEFGTKCWSCDGSLY